ncbi:MAG: recombinase family protein [Candidatus Sulfotelmatobacter sp.]
MTRNAARKAAGNAALYVAYFRVSTKEQGRSGLGLDAQREAVTVYLASVKGKLIAKFEETESGTRKGNHRPQLAAALAQCRVHGATLIIAKLDRLARNVAFTSNLMESSVEFVACDYPEANRLTIHIMAAMAEHEAEMISTRTKLALAQSKKVLGGDRGNLLKRAKGSREITQRIGSRLGNAVRSESAQRRAADLLPVIDAIKADGAVSLRDIAAGLNQRGIATARGGEWSAVQVARVMEQASA